MANPQTTQLTLTLTGSTVAEIAKAAEKFLANSATPATKKSKTPVEDEEDTDAEEAEEVEVDEEDTDAEEEDEAPAAKKGAGRPSNKEKLVAAFQKYAGKYSAAEAHKVLKKLGVKKVAQIKDTDYAKAFKLLGK